VQFKRNGDMPRPLLPNLSPSKEPPQIGESIPHKHPPKKKKGIMARKKRKKKKENQPVPQNISSRQ
jgi:hypothetical protein